jgi:hypothetical protein
MPMTKMYHSISGQIVGDTINSQTRSYLGDGFGNVVGTTNPDSTLQMWFVYRPYGSTASVTGTGIEPVVRWGGSRRMLVVDESNAEYGDARGGSYSVGEGQLTNGNYGEYELPGFPRDWNPFKRGEMPRLTPMPPYKKPPRKNPPPIEIIPPPRQPKPDPKPPRGSILPGIGDTRMDIAVLDLIRCLFCCAVKTKGMGPIGKWLPIDLPIGDCVSDKSFVLPEVEIPIRIPFPPGSEIPVKLPEEGRVGLCKKLREEMKKIGIIVPPEFCKSLFPEEHLPGKDFIDKLKKGMGACNDAKCFVECGLKFNDDMNRAGQPDPWQLCGLETIEECRDCCLSHHNSGTLNKDLLLKCYQQCDDQDYY